MIAMKVAVIGSGASGLTAMKTCLEEGLEPVCFEQEDTIGGLWNFTEEERHSSVYRSTVINTSREMMCFADFPIPKDFSPFMHNTKVMEYFHLYAKHFDLYKYIRFRTKVLDVCKSKDYEETGKWVVTSVSLESPQNQEKKEIFDKVMVCIGHHASPSWPDPPFPGADEFKGVKMHSHAYKDFKNFEGKCILIVGIGNSGGDIAVELSRHAKQVYLSTRKGSWVLSRMHPSGIPIDHWAARRFLFLFPHSMISKQIKAGMNKKFDHKTFGLEPDYEPISQHPTVNDDLPNRIFNGTIIMKPNVDHFTETGVVFNDQTSVDNLDAVIFCTGYRIGFQFLDKSITNVEDNKVTLYKYVFPPHLSKPSLAILGCFQPLGAINPLVDLQCRWVTLVFKGSRVLPSECEMMNDINRKREAMAKRYYASKRHTIQVDYIEYSDELADLIGCKPSFLKLLFTDPVLAYHCYFGPCTPPQYRIMGHGAWSGARELILNADNNAMYSTRSRKVERHDKTDTLWFLAKIVTILILVAAILLKILV